MNEEDFRRLVSAESGREADAAPAKAEVSSEEENRDSSKPRSSNTNVSQQVAERAQGSGGGGGGNASGGAPEDSESIGSESEELSDECGAVEQTQSNSPGESRGDLRKGAAQHDVASHSDREQSGLVLELPDSQEEQVLGEEEEVNLGLEEEGSGSEEGSGEQEEDEEEESEEEEEASLARRDLLSALEQVADKQQSNEAPPLGKAAVDVDTFDITSPPRKWRQVSPADKAKYGLNSIPEQLRSIVVPQLLID